MKRIKKGTIFKVLPPFIIIAIAIFLFAGLLKPINTGEKLSPRQGVLDLSGWHPTQDGLLKLNGNWEFYWHKLLVYDDLNNGKSKPDLLAEVPRIWNTYKINGQSLPGFGYATYRLKIRNTEPGQALAIRMPTVSTAYNLYINERLIAANGKVGKDIEHFIPEYRPVLAEFAPSSGDFDIILQVANFSYARGGAWYPIIMGSVPEIAAYDKNIVSKDLFLLGAFLIMTLYYLCIFLMRKEDRASLYFVLMCLIAIGRTFIYGDYIINRIFPWAGYPAMVTIDYVTLVWFPVVFVLLIAELFPEQASPRIIKAFSSYAALMSLFVILFPIHVYTSLTYPIEAAALAIAAYAVICNMRAFQKHKVDSIIIFIGALALTMGGVHDMLYQNNIISSSFGEFSAFGFLILLFLQALILAGRLSKAYVDASLLSEKLMRLDELKDEFLANTSHELRTPLNAMISIADGLSRGTEGAVNENQKVALDVITSSGKRLASLVNDILDYSKLKHYDLQMNLEPVSLKRMVEGVTNVFARLCKNGVQMIIDIPDGLPDIYADENRLHQILYNLIGNAVKFTETGYVRVSAVRTGEMVEICVADTGIGIAEDQLDAIFESFRQVEASLTRKGEGTGLGLSISKYLVEAHGGKMRAESKVGTGSKFYFLIPISGETAPNRSVRLYETAETEIVATEFNKAYINRFPFKHKGDGPLIMLVDDNEANLISLASILIMENFSITAVTSSEQFFEEFRGESEWHLVILDVMLPGLSGYEICREIRRNFSVSELPVLMLTARITTQDLVMGMEAGANDYLDKPFDTDELLARVNTLIQLKRSVDKSIASELAFLQAQIKPHFLHNTINTVVSISRYDTEQARRLLINFSNYLRRSFDFKGLSQFVPLKNEIELVRDYLDIEKAQFEERLEVTFEVCDDKDIKVPILMLQPVVENALQHGVLPRREGGRIEVSVKRKENELIFTVKDNGVGMDGEKLKNVMADEFGNGVGLSNIDKRLKKLYGKGLLIYSSPGSGTEVSWSVPIK